MRIDSHSATSSTPAVSAMTTQVTREMNAVEYFATSSDVTEAVSFQFVPSMVWASTMLWSSLCVSSLKMFSSEINSSDISFCSG